METKTKASLQESLLPKSVSQEQAPGERVLNQNDPSNVWPEVSSMEVLPGANLATMDQDLGTDQPIEFGKKLFSSEENDKAVKLHREQLVKLRAVHSLPGPIQKASPKAVLPKKVPASSQEEVNITEKIRDNMLKKFEIAQIKKPFTEEMNPSLLPKLGVYTQEGVLKRFFMRGWNKPGCSFDILSESDNYQGIKVSKCISSNLYGG